jgi:hypothetical protein
MSQPRGVFNGLIDEVAVFSVLLTLWPIQQFYANGYKLPKLQVNLLQTGTNLNLTWPQGTWFQSSNVTGPWTPVTTALLPDQLVPTNGSMPYRILLQQTACFTLTIQPMWCLF